MIGRDRPSPVAGCLIEVVPILVGVIVGSLIGTAIGIGLIKMFGLL